MAQYGITIYIFRKLFKSLEDYFPYVCHIPVNTNSARVCYSASQEITLDCFVSRLESSVGIVVEGLAANSRAFSKG